MQDKQKVKHTYELRLWRKELLSSDSKSMAVKKKAITAQIHNFSFCSAILIVYSKIKQNTIMSMSMIQRNLFDFISIHR